MTSAPANRSSWKTTGPTEPLLPIPYEGTFSRDELGAIYRGHVPRGMEDKWFAFFERPYLYFHRSWTGQFIFRVKLEDAGAGARVAEAAVLDDASTYRRQSVEYEASLLSFLVRRILLGRDVPFPVPEGLQEKAPGAYQHSVVGMAVPQVSVTGAKQPKGWLRKLFTRS
jgi:hypothetical protein